jgi:murein DD-endopeptidase MepM/ murein hydrolase activator NlpD
VATIFKRTPDSREEQDESRNREKEIFDEKFNDIAGNYDKKTADPKDEDAAVERAKLRDGEEGAGDKPKKQDDVAESEEKGGGDSPWKTYGSEGGGETQQTGKGRGFIPKSKRARIGIAIVLALLGIGGPISFFGLFSFKLPALTDMITDDAGERVQKLVAKRVEKLMFRALYDRFGNDYNRNFVITGSPLADLYATMRTHNFEKKFRQTTGYSIEKNGNTVRLIHDGKTVVTARNADELMELSYKDKLTGKDFKTITRAHFPAWRYFKAKKFARWLRLQYGIPRYGYDNKDTGDPEKDGQEMYRERLKRLYGFSAKNFLAAINCVMGEANCLMKDKAKINVADGQQSAAGDAVNEAVTDALNQPGDPTAFKKLHQFVIETILKKVGTKAIPILGWIDLVATLDHMAYKLDEDNMIDKIGIFFRKQAAAQEFADIAGIGDQVKWSQRDGKDPINPYFVGLVADKYNTMSEEMAFNYVDGKPDVGTEVPFDQKINDCGLDHKGLDLPLGIGQSFGKECGKSVTQWVIEASYNGDSIMGFIPHQILNIYYETIGEGGLLGWLGGKIGNIFATIASWITPDRFEEAVMAFVGRQFQKLMAIIGRIFVDPNDSTFAFTRAYMGGTVTFDEHCKLELDCRKLSTQEANDIRTQRWEEDYVGFKSRPLYEQIFATDTHRSLVSQLSMRNPVVSPENVNLPNVAKAFASMFNFAASRLATPASAWDFSYRNLFNTIPMGATAKDLEQPLAKEIFDPDAECPNDLDGDFEKTDTFNPCKADMSAVDSIGCMVALDSDACPQETPPGQAAPPGGPVQGGWSWPDKNTSHGLTNCYRKPGHTGIDIGAPTGTDVFAAKSGTIAQTGGGGDSGNYVIINHGGGMWSNYQHLQTVLVKSGPVIGGQTRIGISDNTGFSTGSHLHFSITTQQGLDSRNSVAYSVNPLNYLPKDGRSLNGCN